MQNKFLLVFVVIIVGMGLFFRNNLTKDKVTENLATDRPEIEDQGGLVDNTNSLAIENLRKGDYPGSDLVVEQPLTPGSNYARYIASYTSEGLKIFGLLTVPGGPKPKDGWPVIIFNHGYIPPQEYKTAEKYVAYQDAFAKASYITFKSDYRGHANSEGEPGSAYGANYYTIDVLNALATLKKYPDSNPNKIGMWGHSLGGFLTLRSMVVSPDIKVGIIWAGVVGDYQDLMENWRRPGRVLSSIPSTARRWRDELVSEHGTPQQNPDFWNSISANHYLKDISGPLQLHHGNNDNSVPIEFSYKLEKQMKDAGKQVEMFSYEGDDHNLSYNLSTALKRSVAFFDQYLKN